MALYQLSYDGSRSTVGAGDLLRLSLSGSTPFRLVPEYGPSMTDEDAVDAVLARARERVTPDDEERERLRAAASEVIDRAEAAAADLPVEADVIQVGSTARDTWLSGDRDIDVFVRFPPELDRERLASYGLEVGHETLPDGREEFAEHPYVTGTVDGFDVDLVPCYRLDDATEIRSAVDRTPFHTAYVEDRLDETLAGEVRIVKAFLSAIGAYGSDLRTRGISGYLAELLTLEHGRARDLLATAADEWQPPIEYDPETHAAATFDDPLVVIDPTDPHRNVAAVVSPATVARIQHYARELLDDPRDERLSPRKPDPIVPSVARDVIDERGTTPVALRIPRPDVVDDQLYPQLERSLDGITSALDEHGFEPLRGIVLADDDVAALLVECAIGELSTIERHLGPPVHVRDHAERFAAAYDDDPTTYGPFVDEGRYVVERPRTHTTPEGFLRGDDLTSVALGVRIEEAIDRGDHDLLVGADVSTLADRFGRDLAAYFDPVP